MTIKMSRQSPLINSIQIVHLLTGRGSRSPEIEAYLGANMTQILEIKHYSVQTAQKSLEIWNAQVQAAQPLKIKHVKAQSADIS